MATDEESYSRYRRALTQLDDIALRAELRRNRRDVLRRVTFQRKLSLRLYEFTLLELEQRKTQAYIQELERRLAETETIKAAPSIDPPRDEWAWDVTKTGRPPSNE